MLVEMENERLKLYRRWYKELDAKKAELEEDGSQVDARSQRLLDAELRCLEELITLHSELLLLVPENLGKTAAPEAESLSSRGITTWPGDSQIPPVEGLDLSLVTDMLVLSATSPWVVFVAERFMWNTVYVSPSVKRLLGWRQQELVGVPVHDRCHPDDVQTMVGMFNAGATQSGNSLFYRRMRRDRSYVTVQGTGRILGQRWFAWMELLVAEAEPTQAGSPIRRSNGMSPPTSLSRLTPPPPPLEPPVLPLTPPFLPGSLAASRNLSSHSINDSLMAPSRHFVGGSLDIGKQSHSAPLEKSSASVLGDLQQRSTGGLPVGPLEMARRKGSRPTSPLSEQDSETSFSSGRFNNGQPELMVSHSSGALGISTPALTRSVRPDSLVSMNSAERLRGGSQRAGLRGSGTSSSASGVDMSIPLTQNDVKNFIRPGGPSDQHMSPPSQPLSRSGSGSSGGKPSNLKVAPEMYGAMLSEKEGDPLRASVDHESVLDASGLVGTPLYKESSTADLEDPERWRPQNEESASDVSLSNSLLTPASGGQSPNLPAVGASATASANPRFRNRPSPASRRAYAAPPAAPYGAIVPGPKPEGELDGIRGARVLLVEDDVTNRTVGQRLLESLHCEVTVTCNGKEALEAMRGNPEDPFSLAELGEDEELPPRFDLVLMDLLMPVMDGLRAVEKFRDWEQDQKPRRKRMLIFALTGNVSDGDMVKCAQSGFDEFVSKPLTVEKLLHRLYGVCKTTDRFPGLRMSNFSLPS